MPVSADYVARETATNLWRNRLMTIAAVLTVAVSLALVGAALLLKQGAANAEVEWQRGTQVTVWVNPGAGASETKAIGTQLAQLPIVHSCSFYTKAQDFAEAKKILTPSVFSALTLSSTPPSFRCTPSQPQDAQAVINRFRGQPGVYQVTAPIQSIHAMEKTITVLQWVFVGVALVLLLSAAVLILNTIRMAIFARRREVSVMKLVGATNWFIRLPFMSEGLIQGLIGSLLAAGLVFVLHVVLNYYGNPSNPGAVLTQMRMSGWNVFGTDAVVIIMGVLIGSAGSAAAIRRFLDV
ncbi:MAG TPA: permease-like cell division protein FtsX [Acidimicrobiales bacterium]|nr:permease-like cell division protein FtsX [Acidimicrobiales bacterium]